MREKNNTNLERMRELIEQLTEADIAYYKNDAPIMTDLEYDRLTEELASLEHDTGLVHPVGACGHKTVCRICTCPQGDAHRHGAILPHTDVQVLDPFAGQLVLNAACRAQLCLLLSARHEVR